MKVLLYIFFAVFIISACKKSSSQKPKDDNHGIDIYVSGTSYIPNGHAVACYWKNGVVTNLTAKDGLSAAYGIAIKGNDVYIAGHTLNPTTKLTVATYWINGIAHVLPDDNNTSDAYAITVNGTDIYVAGESTNANGSITSATYWKNGVRHILNGARANVIAVSGSDIYIGGFGYYPDAVSALYWKNDNVINLTPTSEYAEVNGISLNGSDVYLSGFVRSSNSWDLATYWKNGVPVQLEPDTTNSFANAMYINGTDLYFGGSIYTKSGSLKKAYYWKNGNSNKLTDQGNILGIMVNGPDVYMAGSFRDANDLSNAAYWLNGKMVPLSSSYYLSDNSNVAFAWGIVVLQH
ncbi:MAG: hypothetical protein JWR09_4444 [Mucilaginibacter sp.]|nr:hypothetical protein [Mucilaginibacter sp.]